MQQIYTVGANNRSTLKFSFNRAFILFNELKYKDSIYSLALLKRAY